MENIQINGQRIWGPPSDWLGPPPPHGTEVFIRNLPDDVYEIELFHTFSSVGKVYEVRLPVHWSGMNRGYAFVRYTKISEADAAIKAFDMFEIRHARPLKVERSVDNTRLFLSAVPNYKTSEEIENDLSTVVDNVKRVYVYPTLEDPAVFRGYAFVEFKCHRDAAIAKRVLTPDVCFNLFEKKCVAAWANPLPFLDEGVLQTINILFMRNVPKDLKSINLKKSIEMIIGPDTVQKVKRLNDFAFLTFRNHELANKAMDIIKCNPYLFGSNEIQIEWAVPREMTNNCSLNGPKDDKVKVNSFSNRNVKQSLQNNFEVKYPGPIKIRSDINKINENLTHYQKSSELNYMPLGREDKFGKKIFKNPLYDFDRSLGSPPIDHDTPSPIKKTSPAPEELYSYLSKSIRCPDVGQRNGNLVGYYDTFGSKNIDCGREEIMMNPRNFSPDSDFSSYGSEDSFRTNQIRQWLGNVIHSSCSPSPALTTSSADSPTNLSWNCDEGNSRFSPGFGFPMNCEPAVGGKNPGRSMDGKMMTFQQVGKLM